MFSMKFSNCVLVCRVLVHFIKCAIFFSFSSMETLKLKETISRLKIPQQTNKQKQMYFNQNYCFVNSGDAVQTSLVQLEISISRFEPALNLNLWLAVQRCGSNWFYLRAINDNQKPETMITRKLLHMKTTV